jgi:hypothetical protein
MGSKAWFDCGSPAAGWIVLLDASVRRISPGESSSQVGAVNGPPDGASSGQVWVIAVAPCAGFGPESFR